MCYPPFTSISFKSSTSISILPRTLFLVQLSFPSTKRSPLQDGVSIDEDQIRLRKLYTGFNNDIRLSIMAKVSDTIFSILNILKPTVVDTSKKMDNMALNLLYRFLPFLDPAHSYMAIDTTSIVTSMADIITQVVSFWNKMGKEEKKKKKEDEKLETALLVWLLEL